MAMKHALNVDKCNIFKCYLPHSSGVNNSVEHHIRAFSVQRTRTGNSNIAPPNALSKTELFYRFCT